jgi:hypothetical protein
MFESGLHGLVIWTAAAGLAKSAGVCLLLFGCSERVYLVIIKGSVG